MTGSWGRGIMVGVLLLAVAPALASPVVEVENWRFRWGDSPVGPDGRLLWLTEDASGPGWLDGLHRLRPA